MKFDVTGIVLKTERLILRPWTMDDLDDFYEYASVEGVGEMAGWPHHTSKEGTEKVLESFINNREVFAIEYQGKVIGSLGVHEGKAFPELEALSGNEIGYVLSKAYWGRGMMAEAVKKVIGYLFTEKQNDYLLCGYFDFNAQSKRVQEKCGFTPYRKLKFNTVMGTEEPGILSILWNPEKPVPAVTFSHPETLIYPPAVKTAEVMWAECKKTCGIENDDYEAWAFGVSPDKLAGLTHRGEKRATTSAYDVYTAENEPLPKAGDVSIILNSAGFAVCVIRNTSVTVKKFSEVDENYAAMEGEGDKSLSYWQNVHREFFTEEMKSIGKEFTEDMFVVCEEFEVIYS